MLFFIGIHVRKPLLCKKKNIRREVNDGFLCVMGLSDSPMDECLHLDDAQK